MAGDRYFTPAWPVNALLTVEQFHGFTVDPCAGGWDIVDALKAGGVDAAGFDIEPPPILDEEPNEQGASYYHVEGVPRRGDDVVFYTQDFLAWDGVVPEYRGWHRCMNYVTNVPYGFHGKLGVKFIKHMLALTERLGGKVAVLLRVDFDSAGGRRAIFRDHPAFAAKYTLTKRVRWTNMPLVYDKRGRLMEPTDNHAWFVWDWQKRRDTTRAYGYL